MFSSHHLIISSFGSVLRFLLACGSSRLFRPSHLIIVVVSIVALIIVSPLFDTAGRGVRRGASASCLLGSVLLPVPVPMPIAGSWCFLCGVPSVCLPVGSAAG